MTHILLVDDEPSICRGVRRFLQHHAFQVTVAHSLAQARRCLEVQAFDVLLADLRLPDGEGTALLEEQAALPTVIMTAYASVPSAVTAMKLGALDYIAKPFDHDALLLTLRAALRSAQTPQAVCSDDPAKLDDCGLIGRSAAIQTVRQQLQRIASTHSTVLIRGESGTGKEVAARAIHRMSPRAQAPFIPVNCASIPEGLVEAELFGHAQGAYTGAVKARQGLVEAADGGVLFLDEIGELAPAAQARLLRVLQEGEVRPVGANHAQKVNIRLLAATHRDLEAMIDTGDFRADLYYRLRVLEVQIPALRERQADIEPLARHFLTQLSQECQRPGLVLPPTTLQQMQAYPWPGNVRELRNALERAVVLAEGVEIEWAAMNVCQPARHDAGSVQTMVRGAGTSSLNDYFRQFVLGHQGQMSETELARALGISRKTLWERRQREGLPRG